MNALFAMDYRRIAFIGWANSRGVGPYGEVRCRTYIEWSKKRGLFDQKLCLIARNNEESGYELALKLLKRPKRPDAIVTASDNMAVGVYRALHERGIEIGKDIAVTSFNDISVAQFLHPPLSTIRLPAEEIGETAVDMLLERAAGRTIGKQVALASQLIWRGSTRKPGAQQPTSKYLLNILQRSDFLPRLTHQLNSHEAEMGEKHEEICVQQAQRNCCCLRRYKLSCCHSRTSRRNSHRLVLG